MERKKPLAIFLLAALIALGPLGIGFGSKQAAPVDSSSSKDHDVRLLGLRSSQLFPVTNLSLVSWFFLIFFPRWRKLQQVVLIGPMVNAVVYAAVAFLAARNPHAPAVDFSSLEGLELVEADSKGIAKAFKQGAPELRGWIEQDPARLDMLGASFLAYAEERLPEKLPKWSQLLQELLEESAAASLDEDEELQKVAEKAVTQLVKSGLLQAKKKSCEVGDPVLAFLPEDQEWHPAVVEALAPEGRLKLIFIEYGKPQEVPMDEVRAMEDVAEEGEEGEGECEMCQRELKLTFHHLIPKDKHPTYLGKRLPNGIEGEPTRYFLNSYGLMICRQCHNTVHNIASNEVLAAQYNTLQKLLAHPVIQRWVDFAKKRRSSSGKAK